MERQGRNRIREDIREETNTEKKGVTDIQNGTSKEMRKKKTWKEI